MSSFIYTILMYFCCFFWFCVDNIGMSDESVWDRIKLILKEKGITQKSLSERLGYSSRSIEIKINRKSLPDIQEIQNISKILNVSVEWLITGEEGEIPQEIIDLAYEINALPEVYKNFIKADLAKYKSACVSLDEEKISNSS